MEIMELAKTLGEKLKEDERIVAFQKAQSDYENDAKLRELMMELNVQQRAMSNEMKKTEHDTHFIELIQARINQLYDDIRNNPVFAKLHETEQVVNELMNTVNQTIMAQINGEQPDSCTHDCSTCKGCH